MPFTHHMTYIRNLVDSQKHNLKKDTERINRFRLKNESDKEVLHRLGTEEDNICTYFTRDEQLELDEQFKEAYVTLGLNISDHKPIRREMNFGHVKWRIPLEDGEAIIEVNKINKGKWTHTATKS